QFPGNNPGPVAQAKDGTLLLPAEKAEIFGERAAFETEFRNVGYWSGANDEVAWTVRVEKPGAFDVWLDYACSRSAAGDRFTLSAGGEQITASVAATGPDWSHYARAEVGRVRLPAGPHRITVRPAAAPQEALMDLRTVALVPPGASRAWPAD